jgi:hypothetical protein
MAAIDPYQIKLFFQSGRNKKTVLLKKIDSGAGDVSMLLFPIFSHGSGIVSSVCCGQNGIVVR